MWNGNIEEQKQIHTLNIGLRIDTIDEVSLENIVAILFIFGELKKETSNY